MIKHSLSTSSNAIMNINQLPDLCMFAIFSNLSLKQQLANLTVCGRWYSLQLKLFLARKSLTLLLGPEETYKVIEDFDLNPEYSESLLNKDGTRVFPGPVFNLTKDSLRLDFEHFYDDF